MDNFFSNEENKDFKIVNANAEVLVFNFRDRLGSFAMDQASALKINTRIKLGKSIIAIETEKVKSNPVGGFSITLAPNRNWINTLVNGSWLTILMTNDGPIPEEDLERASPKTLKMVGRIDSVRQVVQCDPSSGARSTYYVVTGRDWGCMMDTILYLDPILARGGADQSGYQTGLVMDLFYRDIVDPQIHNKEGAYTTLSTSRVFRGLLNLWGLFTSSNVSKIINWVFEPGSNFKAHSEPFSIPKELIDYLGLISTMSTDADTDETHAFRYLNIIEGPLAKLDSYDATGYKGSDVSIVEGARPVSGIPGTADMYADPFFCLVNPMNFFGQHTAWQLLLEHGNPMLNEMYTEMRFDGDIPRLAIYKRIKPFIINNQLNSEFNSPVLAPCVSNFDYIKKNKIALNDIININVGNNWADRVNFIQVLFDHPLYKEYGINITAYADSCIFDTESLKRDGFCPMIQVTNDLPYIANTLKLNSPDKRLVDTISTDLSKWKHLLKEWYFDAHLMLNGSMTIIGQNNYIEVGDNIYFNSKVLGPSHNMNIFDYNYDRNTVLAHVESVSHSFKLVGDTRSFTTTIKFVRGLIGDENGGIYKKNASYLSQFTDYGSNLDNYSNTMSDEQKLNNNVIDIEK